MQARLRYLSRNKIQIDLIIINIKTLNIKIDLNIKAALDLEAVE